MIDSFSLMPLAQKAGGFFIALAAILVPILIVLLL